MAASDVRLLVGLFIFSLVGFDGRGRLGPYVALSDQKAPHREGIKRLLDKTPFE